MSRSLQNSRFVGVRITVLEKAIERVDNNVDFITNVTNRRDIIQFSNRNIRQDNTL